MNLDHYPLDQWTSKYSPGCEALGLTGSLARGEETSLSDVDLIRFVPQAQLHREIPLRLEECNGYLVSLTAATLRQKRQELRQPQIALWAAPGLRQMVILHDPSGKLARLKNSAAHLTWDTLKPAARIAISHEMRDNAEEVYKILNGLQRGNEGMILYALYGLVLNLMQVMAMHRGVWINTENEYFRLVQDAAGISSPWTAVLRPAAGLAPLAGRESPVVERGRACLQLYLETVDQVNSTLLDEDRPVIQSACRAIKISQ